MAEHFTFKLESLLSHRKFVEDGLQREFVDIGERVSQAKRMEKRLKDTHAHLTEKLKKKLQKPRPVSENCLYVNYLAYLSDRIGKQQKKVQEAETKKREKKVALLKAVKKRKMLERLKETHADQFYKFSLKKEQNVSDEIGIQQYNRKKVS